MERWTARVNILLLAVVTVTALPVGVTLADHGSSGLVVDDHVETTPRNVTVEGETFTVSSVGRVSASDRLTVRVAGPDGVSGVHLTEPNGTIIEGIRTSANRSITFRTGNLTPGEYVLAAHDDFGVFIAAYPVVVTGYETSLSTSTPPSKTDTNTAFTVELSETADAPSAGGVTVVVHGDGTVTRLSATKTDSGTYTVTENLPPGKYEAYAAVRAPAGVDSEGPGELVGLSDALTVTVGDQTDGNATTAPKTTGGAGATTTATATPTPMNATEDQPLVPGLDVPFLPTLTDGGLAALSDLPTDFARTPLTVPTILAGTLLVGLVLSLVAYQTLFTLRRR